MEDILTESLQRPEPTIELPEGASWYAGEDDARCRVIKPNGERCAATRTRATGACPGHSGIGGVNADPYEMSRRAHAEKARRREARVTLGISARRAASPVQQARMAAQVRAQDYARAIVDDPLDDPDLSSLNRQRAAIAALELLYPQVTATMQVDLPEDEEGARTLGWAELQQLAGLHLEGDTGDSTR